MKTEYLEEFLDDATVGFVGSMSKLFTTEGIPLLRGKNIKPYAIDYSDLKFIDSDTHLKWKKSSLAPGDVVLVRVGIPGTCCVIPENIGDINAASLVILRPNTDKLDPYYLSAYLNSLHGRKQIESLNVGSVQSVLNVNIAKKIKIPNHSLEEQKKISRILNILNSKIEVNQKMNETLEEIAKTLFKSWFVDFDPVREKAEGRSTKLSKEISDLFPDSFEDSELGEIPKGWNLSTFGDFVTPIRGKVITKKTTNPGDIPVVAGGLEPAYFHSTANVQGPAVTISASGANAGYTNLYFEDIWASDCSYISNNQSSNVFTSYIFLKFNQERIFDSQHGAAQPHIYPDDLRRLDMVIPNNDLYATFENLITSFFNKIKLNKDQTKNLISLRDALLPKLISGELKIPDSENFIEEAGI